MQETWARKWQTTWKGTRRLDFAAAYACLASREDLTGDLEKIKCPALVVHGSDDTAIPLSKGSRLAAGLPAAEELVVVEGGHAACLTNPEPVNRAIVRFLTSLRTEDI
jgi:pimeloyl-ACP methyl ester carboxylesterase